MKDLDLIMAVWELASGLVSLIAIGFLLHRFSIVNPHAGADSNGV